MADGQVWAWSYPARNHGGLLLALDIYILWKFYVIIIFWLEQLPRFMCRNVTTIYGPHVCGKLHGPAQKAAAVNVRSTSVGPIITLYELWGIVSCTWHLHSMKVDAVTLKSWLSSRIESLDPKYCKNISIILEGSTAVRPLLWMSFSDAAMVSDKYLKSVVEELSEHDGS